jgi:hypothetical protein
MSGYAKLKVSQAYYIAFGDYWRSQLNRTARLKASYSHRFTPSPKFSPQDKSFPFRESNLSIYHVESPVAKPRQVLIMCNNQEGLVEFITQLKE